MDGVQRWAGHGSEMKSNETLAEFNSGGLEGESCSLLCTPASSSSQGWQLERRGRRVCKSRLLSCFLRPLYRFRINRVISGINTIKEFNYD